MKVLITGDRNWSDYGFIKTKLYALKRQHLDLKIMHGGARGADTIAGQVCKELNIECLERPADWEKYGKPAGVIRNQQMLDEFEPDLVMGFHDIIEESKGTKNMLAIAFKAGYKTVLYKHEPPAEIGGSFFEEI